MNSYVYSIRPRDEQLLSVVTENKALKDDNQRLSRENEELRRQLDS